MADRIVSERQSSSIGYVMSKLCIRVKLGSDDPAVKMLAYDVMMLLDEIATVIPATYVDGCVNDLSVAMGRPTSRGAK